MKIQIEVTLAPALSCDQRKADLLAFLPVSGRWEVNDPIAVSLVPFVAGHEAAMNCIGVLEADDFKAELFRKDGRSLDGSDGIVSGILLITRK